MLIGIRLQLLELTDTLLEQTSRRIGQLWGQAQRSVEAQAIREVDRYRAGISIIANAVDDPDLTQEAFRAAVVSAISPLRNTSASQSKLHAIRMELAKAPRRLRAMLKQVGALDLTIAAEHPLGLALATLRQTYDKGRSGLTLEDGNPFAPAAARLVAAAQTPAERLAAYEVACAMLLKRCLRNGTSSAPHSIRHRSVADQLMPSSVWAQVKSQTCRAQEWPTTLDAYLKRFEQPLAARLAILGDAITKGKI